MSFEHGCFAPETRRRDNIRDMDFKENFKLTQSGTTDYHECFMLLRSEKGVRPFKKGTRFKGQSCPASQASGCLGNLGKVG